MMARLKFLWPFLAVGLFLLVWGGWALRSHLRQRAAAQQTAQADQHHEQAIQHAAQGAVHDQASTAQTPVLTADASRVAQLQAEVARLRAAAARPPVPNPVPGMPEPQPVTPPVDLAPLVAAQDALIQGLQQENGDLKVQVLNLTAARDSWHAAYEDEAKASAARASAVTSLQGEYRPWGVGALYGTSQQIGLVAERDLGPVRLGVQVSRRVLPAGNATIDAAATAVWRFR